MFFTSNSNTDSFYKQRLHPPGKEGTPIVAVEGGRVLGCIWMDSFGKSILVVTNEETADSLVLYAPIAKCLAAENQIIKAGQLIGTYGHPPIPRIKDESILIGKITNEFYPGDERTPIFALEDGVVVYTGWYGGYGKSVIVKHADASSLYPHLGMYSVTTNQLVHKGQQIGISRNTGFSGRKRQTGFVVHAKDESTLTGTVSHTDTF